MLSAGIQTPVPLDELEVHLRDLIEEHRRSGEDPGQAFAIAVREVGRPVTLKTEFTKVGVPMAERFKNCILTLAGVPNHQLAADMNTTLEPRWATYLKAGAVMLPAMILWLGMCVFILPKLKWICSESSVPLPGWTVKAVDVSEMIKDNFIPGSLMVATLLVVLEWRSSRWARYRRLVFGVAGFTLNLAVLMFIAVLCVLATVAASQLSYTHVAH